MAHTLNGVKCTVKNCKFWEEGFRCTASAIEVNVDNGGYNASKSYETNCHTFAPKGSM